MQGHGVCAQGIRCEGEGGTPLEMAMRRDQSEASRVLRAAHQREEDEAKRAQREDASDRASDVGSIWSQHATRQQPPSPWKSPLKLFGSGRAGWQPVAMEDSQDWDESEFGYL